MLADENIMKSKHIPSDFFIDCCSAVVLAFLFAKLPTLAFHLGADEWPTLCGTRIELRGGSFRLSISEEVETETICAPAQSLTNGHSVLAFFFAALLARREGSFLFVLVGSVGLVFFEVAAEKVSVNVARK